MLDLQPIKARLEAATPGPWRASPNVQPKNLTAAAEVGHIFILAPESLCRVSTVDAHLIANAPTDLAALVAEVERLRKIIKGAQQELLCNEFLCKPQETGCPKCHKLYTECFYASDNT